MNLCMKQKVFSWGDRFTVWDENGNDRYYVCGEVFSLGKKLHLTDTTGAEVAFIQQKAFSFRPRFYVYMNDVLQAEIVKDFTLFTQHYRVEGMDWEVNGNFGAHDYEISGARGTVASVHKQWFTWGDCYEICISENENEQLVLAVVLAIDAVMAQSSAAAESSKNDYGRILCVCGSAGYTGAAFFAAQGAVRMGSGVVTLAVPERAWPVLAVKLSEPVVRPLPCTEDGLFSVRALPRLLELADHADALLIGCGLGRSDEVTEVVCTLLCEAACPIVLDADGIFALAQHKDILRRTAKPLVMTPHAGEFARLSGKKQMQPEELRAFAQENRCTVLYKAHRTLIAAPDGRLFRNHTGNPGMAKGGSGDTLAGMLVSLIGQGLASEDAACAAAWLHGAAGDSAANRYGEYGMTPTDLLACLPGVTRRYNTREW